MTAPVLAMFAACVAGMIIIWTWSLVFNWPNYDGSKVEYRAFKAMTVLGCMPMAVMTTVTAMTGTTAQLVFTVAASAVVLGLLVAGCRMAKARYIAGMLAAIESEPIDTPRNVAYLTRPKLVLTAGKAVR